jgi:hypothetical protein
MIDDDIKNLLTKTVEGKQPYLDENDHDTAQILEERKQELERLGDLINTLVSSLEITGLDFLKNNTDVSPVMLHTILVGGLAMTTGIALGTIDPTAESQLRNLVIQQLELGYLKGMRTGFALKTPMGNA